MPSFINKLHPLCLLLCKLIFHGIVYNSLFWSIAHFAVINDPLVSSASIIIVAIDKPLIILFLVGKFSGFILSFILYSVIINPLFSIISFANLVFSSGYIFDNPFPKTAIVLPFAASAPICANWSIPFANPLTIVNPCEAYFFANKYA